MQPTGLAPYLYEYIFFRAVDQAQRVTGVPIMTSGARELRRRVDDQIASIAPGASMHTPRLGVNTILSSIDTVLNEAVPGYQPLFAASEGDPRGEVGSAGYTQLLRRFSEMTGQTGQDAHPRLPISPYDPRFSGREVMLEAGHELRFASDEAIGRFVGGETSRVAQASQPAFALQRYNIESASFEDAYQIMTVNDASGLSALAEFMTRDEFVEVSPWVTQIAEGEDSLGSAGFMSAEGIERASTILRSLQREGIEYTIHKDLNPGQIKASITGTKIDVRIMETRDNEHYVGRTYDDGTSIYFSSDIKISGGKRRGYVPTSDDVVNLVRYAQGRPVERTDGQGFVGQNGVSNGRDTYRSDSILSTVYGDYPDAPNGHVLIQKYTKDRTPYFDSMNGESVAREFIQSSINSARENFEEQLKADSIIADVYEHRNEIESGDYQVELSHDSSIASIQQSYIDVLMERRGDLLKPGATEELYEQLVGEIGADASVLSIDGEETRGVAYAGGPVEQVRQHSRDAVEYIIGQYDMHEVTQPDGTIVEQRFDPVRVAQYMTSPSGSWRNTDNLVIAMRQVDEIKPDDLMGTSYYNDAIKDRLIQFDATTSVPMENHSDPFIASMGSVVRESLEHNGVDVASVNIDEQGVVQYTGTRYTSPDVNKPGIEFTGHIGQVFSRGEYGEVVTKFSSGANYMFVPGYEARILPQEPGESKTMEERMVLRGYEDQMRESIQYSIAQTMLDPIPSNTEGPIVVGEAANLNRVYRQLYDIRHPVDYVQRSAEEGLDRDLMEALLKTEAGRVRLSNELRDESSLMADYRDRMGLRESDPRNDNFRDPYLLTGRRNVAVLGHEGDGFFDPMMTSSGKNQGAIRYLAESARVGEDGRIIRGELGDNSPLMNHPAMEHCKHDPFDRRQMTGSNMLQASALTKPVGTAMMTFGGWNFDDGYVISKEFAETHQIRDTQGNMRPIVRGDKLSDLHGNKGVVGLVVDRNMSAQDAEEQGLTKAVEIYRNNPDLDIVMSPFSAVSRFNGGSARELMQDTSDLVLDGRVVEGGIGRQRVIVTHMAVDAKTKIYDEEEISSGKGRKASSQGAWALTSQGADRVMNEIYGSNNAAMANLREFYNVLGVDLDADGSFVVGRTEQSFDDHRQILPMPPVSRHASGVINRQATRAEFAKIIGSQGGDLALPFNLKFPEHTQSPGVPVEMRADGLPQMSNADGSTSYLLPVLSSHLRSGQELDDGTTTVHEYTNAYLDIYMEAVKYKDATEKLAQGGLSADATKRCQKILRESPEAAQNHFNRITSNVVERCIEGKHNQIKEGVMSRKMPDSATAVWTGDPRLKINEVAMSTKTLHALGNPNDDGKLIWRDPMLRSAGMRYMKVTIDDNLTGIAINPVMDKSFDGDFDGDSVAVVSLRDKASKQQARDLLSTDANLLDTDCARQPVVGKDGETHMCYPLAMHDALDAKVSQHVDPELKAEFDEMQIEVNRFEDAFAKGELTLEEVRDAREVMIDELSDYYSRSVGQQYGDAVIEFSDVSRHFESVRHSCIETGAKGSPSKLADYAKYFGAVEEAPGVWKDLGEPQVSQEDHEGVQLAQSVKSTGTAFAGAQTQRCVKATRNTDIAAGLGLTYFITQAALQSKHSPVEALKRFDAIQGPGRLVLQGAVLEPTIDNTGKPSWKAKFGKDGNVEQATRERWITQTKEVYTSENGLNVKDVNPELIERLADALVDDKGYMRNAEEAHELMAPMDQLAYNGSFSTLYEFAQDGRNLFEGKNNQMFMPSQIHRNSEILSQFDAKIQRGEPIFEEPAVEVVAKKDTRVGYTPRPKTSPSATATKRSYTPEPEPEPEPVVDDGYDF